MDRRRARRFGREVMHRLEDVTARATIAGSVRRGEDEVKDVEVVCEPAPRDLALGGESAETVLTRAAELGEVVKGGDRYVQVRLELPGLETGELKLDLFVVRPPAEWGTILAIRTGPAELSRLAVTRLRAMGKRVKAGAVWERTTPEKAIYAKYKVETREMDGELWRKVPTPTEQTFFEAAGMETLPPWQRADMAGGR